MRRSLDIPVFDDDQHGTAIVVLGALRNALRLVDKHLQDIRVIMAGAGAAGIAVARLLVTEGVGQMIVADQRGALHKGRQDLDESKRWLVENTNPDEVRGTITDALAGADVFIGVSGPGGPRAI